MISRTRPLTTALSYARYSTDLQSPTSVSAQHRKNAEHAARVGWQVVEELADHVVSGQTHDRPGLHALLDRVRTGAVDVIVVESLDRLSRDPVDLPRIFKLAEFRGVEIHTLDKGRVTALDVGLAGLLNPLQLAQIAQRTHRSLEEQVIKQGKSAGGLSYGYRIPVDDKGLRVTGELEIDESQATIVLRVFREYAEGRTPREIAAQLNRDGVPSPASGKRKGAGAWAQTTITGNRARGTGLLNNELYMGRRIWNRLDWVIHPETRKRIPRPRDASEHVIAEVPHLRIVPQDLWDAVKARQGANDVTRAKRPAADPKGLSASQGVRQIKYLLSGLLRCGCCDGCLTIAGSGQQRYYCSNAKQKGDAVCAGMPGIRQDEVERRVLHGLERHLLTDEAYAAFEAKVEEQAAVLTERANADIRRVDAQISEAREAVTHLVAAIAKGRHSAALMSALEQAEASLTALETTRATMTPVLIDLPADLPEVFRTQVSCLAASLTHDVALGRAAHTLRGLIDRVVITWDVVAERHDMAIEGHLGALLQLGGADADMTKGEGSDSPRQRLVPEGGDHDDVPEGPHPPSGPRGRRPARGDAGETSHGRSAAIGHTRASRGVNASAALSHSGTHGKASAEAPGRQGYDIRAISGEAVGRGCPTANDKNAAAFRRAACSLELVAGAGFEPAAFRL